MSAHEVDRIHKINREVQEEKKRVAEERDELV
jgi:hypothetical protein